ncbi:MAG: hypothetical protein KDA83_19395, partial [Planctomycetales bacterium]|nr:hypothetical protein [Planctomycetales bacterium]
MAPRFSSWPIGGSRFPSLLKLLRRRHSRRQATHLPSRARAWRLTAPELVSTVRYTPLVPVAVATLLGHAASAWAIPSIGAGAFTLLALVAGWLVTGIVSPRPGRVHLRLGLLLAIC